ncbi:type II toxin-antitoxin system PemK/MazF family toxin [Sphingomonas sp. PAMC 26605]|uniref:type II toxin-antitoxin system PemK/MazF family toxin n=1 Tax=Sphingomonas sp. PAMC 26605 TaxID=1112214 RepID=UPI0004964749|nr:type II toxin-antitoxin system PemK/MazF family toxin [Sphingomonas sp. PAMC 26605]
MNRGEVWSAATGSGFGGKPCPVVIVQATLFSHTPNIIVALCNSAGASSDAVRPRVFPDADNGLHEISDIAVDLLVTVPRRKFGQCFGRLSPADLHRVDQALLLILGFA